jgi:hypothetical protein
MIEQEYLKYCLNQIEKKLDWKSSQFWKESDYLKLAQIISEASNISISPHTLKRLFGKIKYKKFYNPQQATKDALSKYLGYVQWDDFVEKTKDKVVKKIEIPNLKEAKVKGNKFLLILISIVAIGLFLVVFVNGNNDVENKIEPFAFGLKDSVGVVPFTVPVYYNISEIRTDSVFIDFDFEHPFRGKQIVKPNKSGSTHNFTYQIPGYYQVQLKKKEDTIAINKVLAMSETWDSYFVQESNLGEFWLDNEIEQYRDSLGYLYFSPKKLIDKGFDTSKVFYIHNRLFREFGIDGDNFEFETRFKSTKDLGGITCYDFVMRLVCEKNLNYINLVENGCSQYSGIRFGETALSGGRDNLSDFKINVEDWNVLSVTVKQKQVEVFINNELIYKEKYQQPNGKIVGIENVFKGSGLLDYIKIKDLNSDKTFIENFNSN